MNTFIHSYEFPPEPYPISDPNGQSLYPLSDQNGTETLPFGAAHTYTAYIREYPALPGQKVSANENFKSIEWNKITHPPSKAKASSDKIKPARKCCCLNAVDNSAMLLPMITV